MNKTKKHTIPMSNRGGRTPEIDIIKGIAIVLVVYGHTFPFFREYIYLFHIAVFLMASGYCWKDNKITNFSTWFSFLIGKLKSLYLPYIICNGIYLLLRNFFVAINIYSDNPVFLEITQNSIYQQQLTPKLSFQGYMVESVKILLGTGTTQLGSATWFLIALFIVIAIHATLTLSIKNCKYRKIVFIIVFCCLAVAAFFVNKTGFRGEFRRIPCTYMAFLMGFFAKQLDMKKYCNKWWVAGIAFASLVLLSRIGTIEMSAAHIQNPLFFIIASYAGWIMLYYIATILMRYEGIHRCLEYIGKHTMSVLCMHLLAFKLVSFVYIIVSNKPAYLLASFHIIFDVPVIYKLFYTIAGVLMPLILCYLWNKFTGRLVRRIPIRNS